MANRYWIGGTGNWSDTAHWSTASGGSGGASIPTSADNVYIDQPGTYTVTLDVTANCLALDFTGSTIATLARGANTLNIYGDLIHTASTTQSGSNAIYMKSTGVCSIDTKGGSLGSGSIYFDGVGGIFNLASNFNSSSCDLYVRNGTFNTNNYNITCWVFYISYTTARTVNLGSSTIDISTRFDATTTTALTFNAGTSTIKINGSGTYTSNLANLTYYNFEVNNNNHTITGSNTFNTLKIYAGRTLKLTSGTTQTVTSFIATGLSGSIITLKSTTAGSPATISKASGTVTVSYCSIQDITATGGAVFVATNSTDVSGNTGWDFGVGSGSANITATSTLTANGINIVSGTVNISNTTALTADGVNIITGQANLTATTSLTVDGGFIYLGSSSIVTTSNLNADGVTMITGQAAINSTSTLTVTGVKLIKTGLANSPTKSFKMNSNLYLMTGAEYLVYDGSTVKDVSTVAYIPTVIVSSPPTGGGQVLEDFNLLSAGFKTEFSGNGSATAYTLPLSGLDATLVTATVNGVAKVETTDFTVNRSTGVVTFSVAPASGTNNVVITAYKTQTGFADRIKKCTNFVMFGGDNDTRVFVGGQDNIVRWCDVGDPTYWPENSYNEVGNDSAKVTGFAKQYDYCLILKEVSPNDSPIWMMNFALNDGDVSFPVKPINDAVGCSAPGTIQILDNDPTFLDRTGIYQVKASNVRDERNVQQISAKVDPRLLNEPNLQNAVSVDYNNKYYIAVNGNVYVFDYKFVNPITGEQGAWLPWDNIPASCFLEMDGYLYFGSSSSGLVYKFKKTTDSGVYNDDGQPINAYLYTKQLDFGAPERWKIINKAYVGLKPDSNASVDVYYVTDKNIATYLKTIRVNIFDFRNIDFGNMNFIVSNFPVEKKTNIKAKKITYFQLLLKNNRVNENMSLLNASVLFNYQGYAK